MRADARGGDGSVPEKLATGVGSFEGARMWINDAGRQALAAAKS